MMNQQVIKELMQLIGKQQIEFTDLKVKMSPHSFPNIITAISYNASSQVFAAVDGERVAWDHLTEPVKNTISQRLGLLLRANKQIK